MANPTHLSPSLFLCLFPFTLPLLHYNPQCAGIYIEWEGVIRGTLDAVRSRERGKGGLVVCSVSLVTLCPNPSLNLLPCQSPPEADNEEPLLSGAVL